MLELVLGLLLFLGVHSLRIFADGWRSAMIERIGALPWKGVYALASLLGFWLMIRGWSQVRVEPVVLWTTPVALRHVAAPLTLLAFVLWLAAYVPGNLIRSRLHHPMVLGTKTWALAHLLANNSVADLVLFGSFLLWSVVLFVASRRRDRREQAPVAPGRMGPTLVTVVLGLLAWAAFAYGLHGVLIGVRPLGGG
ncbi:MAG: NnrU family protein [Betaproteobacteria bacterium]